MQLYIQSLMSGLFSHSTGIKVIIEFHMPIPPSWSNKRQKLAEGKPHTSRPDIDNLVKFIGDALNEILWVDDSIIYEWHVQKIYSFTPKTRIEVIPIEEKNVAPLLSQ